MTSCLYCPAPLGDSTRSLAHVFARSLGGRLASPKICCAVCNNSFTQMETVCAERLALSSALTASRKGDNTPIGARYSAGGVKFYVEDGLMFEDAPSPRERGRVWPLPANPERQATLLATSLRQRRLHPDALLDGRVSLEDELDDVSASRTIPVDPTNVPSPFVWNDAPTRRLSTKMACELLAYDHPDLARSPSLRKALTYARHGDGDIDLRVDTLTEATRLPFVEAPLVHAIEVWTRATRLHFRLTLFSVYRFVGTLTTAWAAHSLRIMYCFNTRAPIELGYLTQPGDGDFLVNRSRATSQNEIINAAQSYRRITEGLFPNSAVMQGRHPKLTELHEWVVRLYKQRPWET
jgi:HNH endonuclease